MMFTIPEVFIDYPNPISVTYVYVFLGRVLTFLVFCVVYSYLTYSVLIVSSFLGFASLHGVLPL